MKIPFFQVDAFALGPGLRFTGNPAAVCLLPHWLEDSMLLQIAAENNLSETAFLVAQTGPALPSPRDPIYELRWFTPTVEVALCGHATLASAQILFEQRHSDAQALRFETRRSGALYAERSGDLIRLELPLHAEWKTGTAAPADLLKGLGQTPLEVLHTPYQTWIAVFRDPAEIRALQPDFAALSRLKDCVCVTATASEDCDFVSRYFAPAYGIPEDPVTGSAHCLLAPFWAKRLRKNPLLARQISPRGGELLCEVQADCVSVAGRAVKVIEGSFLL